MKFIRTQDQIVSLENILEVIASGITEDTCQRNYQKVTEYSAYITIYYTSSDRKSILCSPKFQDKAEVYKWIDDTLIEIADILKK